MLTLFNVQIVTCKFFLTNVLFFEKVWHICGPGGVVGIATGCGLDGPGIESQWRRDFPHLSKPVLGPTQPPV